MAAKEKDKEDEKKSIDYISSISDTIKGINEKYDKIRKERIFPTAKSTVEDKPRIQSATKITGLRGLEPKFGTQFTKDRNKYLQ
jgi:hypothetical protein